MLTVVITRHAWPQLQKYNAGDEYSSSHYHFQFLSLHGISVEQECTVGQTVKAASSTYSSISKAAAPKQKQARTAAGNHASILAPVAADNDTAASTFPQDATPAGNDASSLAPPVPE
jgi:hypothetical protein